MAPDHGSRAPVVSASVPAVPGRTVAATDSGPAAARLHELLNARPLPLLIRLATPNAVAFIIQAAVSFTEIWYVGQLGTSALAAIALVFPLLMLMQMMSGGALGGAVNAAVARAIGAGRHDHVAVLLWQTLAVGVVGSLFFLVLHVLLSPTLLALLGGHGDVLTQALAYADIVFAASLGLWVSNLLAGAWRGMGDVRFPALTMIVGACLQVPLSGALILGWFGAPQLGIVGAAISAVSISALMAMVSIWRLCSRHAPVRLQWRAMRRDDGALIDILRIGAPSALSPLITVGSIAGLTALVAPFGVEVLAGYGIGSRVEFLMVPLVFGIGVAMTSTVGTAMGAGNYRRALHVGWTGAILAAALAGTVGIVLAVMPSAFVGAFTDDPAAHAAAVGYLRHVGPFYAFLGAGLSLYFASQGAGRVGWPLLASGLRLAISVGAGAWCVHAFGSLDALYVCIAIGMFVYGTLTVAAIHLGAWRPR